VNEIAISDGNCWARQVVVTRGPNRKGGMSGPVRRIPPFAPKLKTQRRASPQTLGHPRFARGTEKTPESPGNPFGKEENLGDNSRKVENGKASCFGGFREAFIGTHKVSLGGTLLAPGKGCGQLQASSGPQFVSV